jgi:hypothetical protein
VGSWLIAKPARHHSGENRCLEAVEQLNATYVKLAVCEAGQALLRQAALHN